MKVSFFDLSSNLVQIRGKIKKTKSSGTKHEDITDFLCCERGALIKEEDIGNILEY